MRPAAAVLALAMLAAPPAAAAQDVPFDADPAHTNAARQAKKFAHAGRDARRRAHARAQPRSRRRAGSTAARRSRCAATSTRWSPPPRARQTVPVLVAYNVPNRDCSQYSAGGARNGRAYRAWIDGFARGIGDRPAARDPRAGRARRAVRQGPPRPPARRRRPARARPDRRSTSTPGTRTGSRPA